MDDSLTILKNFEAALKKCLLDYFGALLPQDKIALLNTTNYINMNDFKNMTSNKEVQGHILRSMLKDIVNVNCEKEIAINENETVKVAYGEPLQKALIEYYAQEISKKYKFDINEIPELKDNLELVEELKKALDKNFNSQVLNNNATNLLKLTGLKNIEQKLDEDTIKKYLDNNKQINNAIESNDIKKQEQIIEEYTTEEGKIQFVYLDNELYLKYIDSNDKVHLVKINQDSKVISYYKEKIASLSPDQKINPEEFFNEISELISEENLTDTKDIKAENITHEEVNMLNFINSNKKVNDLAKNDEITHTDNAKIHVIEETNAVVTTNDTGMHVEGEIIEDKNDGLENKSLADDNQLTPEQYEELCMKFARGETTKEEEKLLENSNPYLANSLLKSEGPVLTKKSSYGIANNEIIIYLALVGMIIVMTIGYIIVTIK